MKLIIKIFFFSFLLISQLSAVDWNNSEYKFYSIGRDERIFIIKEKLEKSNDELEKKILKINFSIEADYYLNVTQQLLNFFSNSLETEMKEKADPENVKNLQNLCSKYVEDITKLQNMVEKVKKM